MTSTTTPRRAIDRDAHHLIADLAAVHGNTKQAKLIVNSALAGSDERRSLHDQRVVAAALAIVFGEYITRIEH